MYVRRKQKMLIAVTLLVIACLIVSGTYVYYAYYAVEKKVTVQETPFSLDDRISPLENQGVVLEVLRIRHRGLLDKLLKPGNSWKSSPAFYFVTNMDGLEYVSKDVTQHGRTAEILFTTWDTMFQENKIVKDAEEEQEYSTITLTIMEQVKSGILGRKTSNVARDSVEVTYDYRTGRWTGNDNFKDDDGYGHFLGDTFEVWFNIYQFDYDNDFIPYWTEVNILGTDPGVDDSTLDPDNDSLPTAWEWRWGYDPFTWDDHKNLDPDLDGIDNYEEYQMRKYLSDPFSENIYYEVDYMGSGGLRDPPHYLLEESKQGIIERFAQNNIQCMFDDGWADSPNNGGGQVLPHIDKISQDSGMMLQFYQHYFPDDRKGIFRYLVIGHGGGFQHPSKNNIYDCTQISYMTTKFKPITQIYNYVLLGLLPTERGKRVSLGSLILHEMAHSCSVDADNCAFEGIDNVSYGLYILPDKNYKATWGQYHSVLNYLYCNGPKTLDLSHGQNGAPYDQDDWGMMFVGFFQYNAELVEEPFYTPQGGKNKIEIEQAKITGYVYDENLTAQFIDQVGGWSPNVRYNVNWSVYRLVDNAQFPQYRTIKVFAQPKIKTTQQWVLSREGDIDIEGDIQFYSFDEILEEKTK